MVDDDSDFFVFGWVKPLLSCLVFQQEEVVGLYANANQSKQHTLISSLSVEI
jgi:hypothetical protein